MLRRGNSCHNLRGRRELRLRRLALDRLVLMPCASILSVMAHVLAPSCASDTYVSTLRQHRDTNVSIFVVSSSVTPVFAITVATASGNASDSPPPLMGRAPPLLCLRVFVVVQGPAAKFLFQGLINIVGKGFERGCIKQIVYVPTVLQCRLQDVIVLGAEDRVVHDGER